MLVKESKYQTGFAREFGNGVNETSVALKFFPVKTKHGGHGSGIAIEFTPTKLGSEDWCVFRSLLNAIIYGGCKAVLKEFLVYRLEVAVDIKSPLEDLLCISPGIEVENLNYLAKGTRYLGQKGGSRTYCIYDKRKQLADKVAVDLGSDLSRVEVRLRYLGKRLHELPLVKEPFRDLLVIRRAALLRLREKNPKDYLLIALSKRLDAGKSAHEAYLMETKHFRKQLVERLRPAGIVLNPKQEYWDKWVAEKTQMILSGFGVSGA
jgi:hypothetical protein